MNGTTNGNSEWTWWNPENELKEVSSKEIIYSRGFLQSDIARLCPSFPSFWDSFIEKYSFDVNSIEVKPLLEIPSNLQNVYKGTIDKEDIFVCYDAESFAYISNVIIPSENPKIMKIVMEYLTRRLMSSFSFSWIASDNAIIYFDGECEDIHPKGEACIRLSMRVAGTRVSIFVVCPYSIVNIIDKSWRGQIQSTSKYRDVPETKLNIEIAELAISPSMINSYLSSNVRVGLEKIVNDNVIIKKDGRKILKGKLLRSGDKFVVEILGGVDSQNTLPQGTVSISIELGEVVVPGYVLSEILQKNILWNTGLSLSNEVDILVDNKPSTHALLASYDRQFAIEVKSR